MFSYQAGFLDDGLMTIALLLPVLMFIGFFGAKILFKDHDYADPTDVVVMPPDLTWPNYTNNLDVIVEISRAVVGLRVKSPVSYAQLQPHLRSKEAHRIAELVQEFHVYREEEIRAFLQQLNQRKKKPHLQELA
ncbi:MAG: hypothetical protein WCC10_08355 [Tumebacillaceae bacterium]